MTMRRSPGRFDPAPLLDHDARPPARRTKAPRAVAWSSVVGDLHGEDIRNALALLGMVVVLGLGLAAGGWLIDAYVLR
jgi:hypothetical protein